MGQARLSVTSAEAFEQFGRLLGLDAPSHERELDALKRARPDLYPQVLALVESDRRASARDFLETAPQLAPPEADASEREAPATEAPALLQAGQTLGAYRIERSIGAGGMGEVWLATRADGRYQGHVAIKALHPLLARAAIGGRFVREGEILARLSHPNIARLLDAGVSDAGLPYLVLEYVDGERIDRFCEQRALDVPARVRLFLQVCEAVAHAHTRLAVHRDLKPSNILVTADGTAKLLDFGIAKLLETTDTPAPATELTRLSGRVLTPEYAAPEQVKGEPITTATDVYSLGMILFGLLSGSRPYGDTTATPAQLERDVTHTEPQRLSSVAPVSLRRALRGDLDNILAKALKKKPAERYASAQALADDLSRYLNFQPVSARPDSLGYRARKFLRRNRIGVAAGSIVALAMVAGTAVALWQAQRATAEAARARAEASRLIRVQDFIYRAMDQVNPLQPDRLALTESERWDLIVKEAEAEFADDLDLQARLLSDFANMMTVRAQWDRAKAMLERVLALFLQLHGPDDWRVALAYTRLAFVHGFRGQFSLTWPHVERAYEIASKRRDAMPYTYIEAAGDKTTALIMQGRIDEAALLADELLRRIRTTPRVDPEQLVFQLIRIARIRLAQGRYDEARAALMEAFPVAEKRDGPNNTYRLPLYLWLAAIARAQGNVEEELDFAERCLDVVRKHWKGDYFYPAQAMLTAGIARSRAGQNAEAESVMREAIAMQQRIEDETIAASYRALATHLLARGDAARARAEIDAGLAACSRFPFDIENNCAALRAMKDEPPRQ